MFQDIFRNKRVLVTGSTGFKGSWLMLWLKDLGAEVFGFGLEPDTNPNHFSLICDKTQTTIGDLKDKSTIDNLIKEIQPEIIFHLAAQSLVRRSYREPLDTYLTNVIGTLNILEASRNLAKPKAIIIVTSDKVYENKEQLQPYKETDELGGYDLYSSSKACAEILTSSYIRSFFNPNDFGTKHQTLVVTVRAGNVIGGGDWCEDRLIPDIIRAVQKNESVTIRNPNSVRPWQHVLDPLSGYLCLASQLLKNRSDLVGAWNFGPEPTSFRTVGELQLKMHEYWSAVKLPTINSPNENLHEAGLLSVDSSKSKSFLNWKPVWSFDDATHKTIDWYKNYILSNKVISQEQLTAYIRDAKINGLAWAQ